MNSPAPQEIFVNTERRPLGQLVRAQISWNIDILGQKSLRILGRYNLVYTIAGRCTYIDQNWKSRQFVPGDGFFVFPDVPHLYGPTPGHDWAQFCIAFDGPIFDLWRAQGVITPQRFTLRLLPVDYWVRRFKAMVREAAEAHATAPLLSLCAVQSLIAEVITTDAQAKTGDEDRLWLATAQRMLSDVHRADELNLEKIAEQLNMPYVSFRKKFAALAGMPPARYHANALMKRACQLMQSDHLKNGELADRLGFSSEYHFSRRFHQVVGVTPRQFRQDLLKHPI